MSNERRSRTSFIQVMYDVYWKDRVARVEAIAGTVLLSAVIISLVNAANKQAESSTPTILPTPSCLVDRSPLPSQSVSIAVFDARTCPSSSR
jgi:hypothetical protein